MKKLQNKSLIILLAIQAIALILYPPAFLARAPQARVLPPALLLLFILALVAMNTGAISPTGGRNSLSFVQGINIVVRLMTLLPNLKGEAGGWNVLLLIAQVLGIGLSWYALTQMERRPPRDLLFREEPPTPSRP
jgi:hypothetical protein